jgi:gamma-glutamyltranspeptidase/glutathione hydrolase
MDGRRPTIMARGGMVAAAHPLAAASGAEALLQGGNAFDAAAATAAALNVVEPFMSGLAGLGIATCYVAAERRVRVLDFVPPVPSRLPVERLSRRSDLERGALSVGVPGNLAGWAELVRAYGRRPFADALAPAIRLARDGVALAEFGVSEFNEQIPVIKGLAELRADWEQNYNSRRLDRIALGHVLVQPDLARTFEAIAEKGASWFFGGALGERTIAHVTRLGGCLTLADLAAVKPVWREPMSVSFRGLEVNAPPPPSEAFQFLLTLRILEGFELAGLERNGIDHLDTVLRAIRLAAGERIAHNNATADVARSLLADGHVERLRARVRDGRPIDGPTEQWTPPSGPASGGEHHTTSFSVADRDGNLVCITQSLGSLFGSGVVVPGTGICLNNFLYWADIDARSPNRTRPGAALPICLAPSISLEAGEAVLALGTPGSYGILQTQVQALVQHRVFGLSLQDAIEAPRVRLWDGTLIEPESRIGMAVMEGLARKGHRIEPGAAWTMRVGGMHGVRRDPATGFLTGACDPRRDGYVAAVP